MFYLVASTRASIPRGRPWNNTDRHRRLDREAALLTRQAEADAHRWDEADSNTLSSWAPQSPSSSPSHRARSRFGEGRRDGSSQGAAKAQGSAPGLAYGGSFSSSSGRSGGGGDYSSGVISGGDGGDAMSGGTGGGTGAAAISWDRELARTLAREGPAAPGWSSRWRPGMPGSRAALGLWERAGGLDEDGGEDGHGEEVEEARRRRAGGREASPRGNVDTAQEVGTKPGWVRFSFDSGS